MAKCPSFPFPVGTLVTVAARTWPGINKHGGSGKVVAAYVDNDGVHRVDVRYVLNGLEKNIETEFVTKQIYLEAKTRVRKPRDILGQALDIPAEKKTKSSSLQPSTQNKSKDKKNVKKKAANRKRKSASEQVSVIQNKKVSVTPTPEKKKQRHEPSKKTTLISFPEPVNTQFCNEKEEEDIEPSIPREITIVSCATSAGSLSFNENLVNAASKHLSNMKKSRPRMNQKQKQLSLAAKSSRKMTEFFTKNSPPPPLGLVQRSTQTIATTTKSKGLKISRRNQEKIPESSKTKFTIHHDSNIDQEAPFVNTIPDLNFGAKRNKSNVKNQDGDHAKIKKTIRITPKTSKVCLTHRNHKNTKIPPLKELKNMFKRPSQQTNGTKPGSKQAPKQLVLPQKDINSIESSRRTSNLSSSASVNSKIDEPVSTSAQEHHNNSNDKSVPDPFLESKKQEVISEERIEMFTKVFSQVLSKQMVQEIQLEELIIQANTYMINNAKFERREVVECVKKLEKQNRVMFVEESGGIFFI